MSDTVTYPDQPIAETFLRSMEYGGYVVSQSHREGYYPNQVAFSTLDEALKWLKKAMRK